MQHNNPDDSLTSRVKDGFSYLAGFFAPAVAAICNGMGAVVGIEPETEEEKTEQSSQKSLKK